MKTNKTVKTISIINNHDKLSITLSNDMKFSELVMAWTFMTDFIFRICEGQGNGIHALKGGDKERAECKRIFYPALEEWIAYLRQGNEADNT